MKVHFMTYSEQAILRRPEEHTVGERQARCGRSVPVASARVVSPREQGDVTCLPCLRDAARELAFEADYTERTLGLVRLRIDELLTEKRGAA